MEELIRRVSEKTGISEEQARGAVTTVLGFLKEKLPAPIAGQLDNVVGSGSSPEGSVGGISNIASNLGGMFGGGGESGNS